MDLCVTYRAYAEHSESLFGTRPTQTNPAQRSKIVAVKTKTSAPTIVETKDRSVPVIVQYHQPAPHDRHNDTTHGPLIKTLHDEISLRDDTSLHELLDRLTRQNYITLPEVVDGANRYTVVEVMLENGEYLSITEGSWKGLRGVLMQ